VSRALGFAPVVAEGARVLILGSMPGQRSLDQQQYYAHARNSFWPIMAELFGFSLEQPYPERLRLLQRQGIALWDTLASCERSGSLDAAIIETSIQANDFVQLFQRYPTLDTVFFNGAKSEQSYRKYVLGMLTGAAQPERLHRLPSTSPAYASLSYAQKLQQWRQVQQALAG
jgi:TDG/mug DNA glycosylase family protein